MQSFPLCIFSAEIFRVLSDLLMSACDFGIAGDRNERLEHVFPLLIKKIYLMLPMITFLFFSLCVYNG